MEDKNKRRAMPWLGAMGGLAFSVWDKLKFSSGIAKKSMPLLNVAFLKRALLLSAIGASAALAFIVIADWLNSEKLQEHKELVEAKPIHEASYAKILKQFDAKSKELASTQQALRLAKSHSDDVEEKNADLASQLVRSTRDPVSAFQGKPRTRPRAPTSQQLC